MKVYQVFIVRIWQEQATDKDRETRFSIEDTTTGHRHGFTSVSDLAQFLRQQVNQTDLEGGDAIDLD